MKAKLVGGVLTRSETAAGFINKNFEIIAWVFVDLSNDQQLFRDSEEFITTMFMVAATD